MNEILVIDRVTGEVLDTIPGDEQNDEVAVLTHEELERLITWALKEGIQVIFVD
jgi:hypothetical protein